MRTTADPGLTVTLEFSCNARYVLPYGSGSSHRSAVLADCRREKVFCPPCDPPRITDRVLGLILWGDGAAQVDIRLR